MLWHLKSVLSHSTQPQEWEGGITVELFLEVTPIDENWQLETEDNIYKTFSGQFIIFCDKLECFTQVDIPS